MMRESRQINIGNVKTGGSAPVSIQSMLNVPAEDIAGSVLQAKRLCEAGCDIIRAAVPKLECVPLITALKNAVNCPIVADIHFDYRIALACVEAGADKIRINPGNIGDEERVKAVAKACNNAGIPIRIGVNSGSLEKSVLEKYSAPTAEALCESALINAAMLEKFDFNNIVISIKSSSAKTTFEANKLIAGMCKYPLHIGVTEAGTQNTGIIKSAAAIGGLLLDGIGDTIRISLTADPVCEVDAAKKLLNAIGFRKDGPIVISCPTCGRTKIDIISITNKVEELLKDCKKNITVAVMGCVVNGPGEAREADIGIAGGDGCGIIFKKGEIIKKVSESELISELMAQIERL